MSRTKERERERERGMEDVNKTGRSKGMKGWKEGTKKGVKGECVMKGRTERGMRMCCAGREG